MMIPYPALRYLKSKTPQPPDPLQCNAYPSLGSGVPIRIYQVYCCRKDKIFFFSFVNLHPGVKINSIIIKITMCSSTEKQLSTQRYKCVFLLKGIIC